MKKILLVIIIVVMLVVPTLATGFSPLSTNEKNIMDFIAKVAVRVRIPVEQVYRDVFFCKFEEAKLTEEEINDLTNDEKIWYEQGYIVKYGRWKDKEDEIVETAIYGSGTIIFSYFLPLVMQSPEKGIVAETLVMTNYHVIQPLVDKLSLGSRDKPINVYKEIDLKTSIDPPKVKIREGARPIAQKYSYLVDEEGEPYNWIATVNKASISLSAGQNFNIEAVVVAYDKGLDVGILQVKNVAYQTYATFRWIECKVGEKVWMRHCPLSYMFSTDRGYVNQTHLDLGIDPDGLGWMNQVKLDIPSAPGSSGSGVFDEEGYLIALFHGGLIHQMGQGYSFIEGGHLSHEGTEVAIWLYWAGFGYIFEKGIHKDQHALKLAKQVETKEDIINKE